MRVTFALLLRDLILAGPPVPRSLLRLWTLQRPGMSPRRNPAPPPRGVYDRKTEMITGTVKFFNTTKGYGFIQPEDGSKDAFVHISAVERAGLTSLAEGQKVTYELQTGRDGKVSADRLQLVR
jgi:CspA family cold shock protein